MRQRRVSGQVRALKRFWVIVVSVGVAVSGLMSDVSCLSVQAAELKVGYVNLAKVFDGYDRTKASDATLEKQGKQKDAELEGRMNELKKLRQSLELLNDEAKEAKRREIEEKSDEMQRFRTSTARDLRRDRDRVAKDILDDIEKALQEYAKTNGYAFIFDSRSLLYGESAHDVTDEVLKLLNSKGKKPAQ